MPPHRVAGAVPLLAWSALALTSCVIDQPGMGLLEAPRSPHALFPRTSSPQAESNAPTPRDAVAEPPHAPAAPACQDTFLPPFDTPLTWRAAYRSATRGQYHHCPAWSSYGPVRPNGKWHRGLDIASPSGTPVHGAIAGVLSYGRDPNGWGLFARLRFRPSIRTANGTCSHGEPLELLYAHLQEDSAAFPPGEERQVAAGTIVGRVGCSGNARGMCSPSLESHVHVTLRTIADHKQIDPQPLLGWKPASPGPADFQPSLLPCP